MLMGAMAQRARELNAEGSAAFPRLLNIVYLTNDILCACKRRRGDSAEWWTDPLCVAVRRHLGCVLCCAHLVSAGQEGQERIGQMMVFWTERGMLDAETQTLLAQQCGARDVHSPLPEPPNVTGAQLAPPPPQPPQPGRGLHSSTFLLNLSRF